MTVLVVEILVRRLREALDLTIIAGKGEVGLELPLASRHLLLAHDLRLGAEIHFLVLREIIDGPVFLVESAEVLVIVRVVMIVECVHALVRLIHFRIAAVGHKVQAALIEDLADLRRIKVLQ